MQIISPIMALLLTSGQQQNESRRFEFLATTRYSRCFSDEDNSLVETEAVTLTRRNILKQIGKVSVAGFALPSNAAVTDESDTYADNFWSADANRSSPSSTLTIPSSGSSKTPTDEIEIEVPKSLLQQGGLGIELSQVEFRTNIRVFIKTVTPGSTADKLGIKKDWIVVGINGESAERTNAEGVAIMVSRAVRSQSSDSSGSIKLRFRDPAVFRSQVSNLKEGERATTQVAPAGDTSQRNADGSLKPGMTVREQEDQRLSVTQLVKPKLCNRGAEVDDLLEISYVGRVVETGQIFDGSAVAIDGSGIPGRGNDVSIFFVLGKQSFGQFPPGWDVGLYGMCVGERRRLIIPPALAYGSQGLPRRGIPPNAFLQYDVSLVSINGLSTPQ